MSLSSVEQVSLKINESVLFLIQPNCDLVIVVGSPHRCGRLKCRLVPLNGLRQTEQCQLQHPHHVHRARAPFP